MLHMNQQPRYQRIWGELKTVYVCRGTSAAHYMAGLTLGAEIIRGLSDTERHNLNRIFDEARNAKR
jgi:hypothetical protein